MTLPGTMLAASWRPVALGCRHRKPASEDPASLHAPAVCQHPSRAGDGCSAADAALGRCPIIGACIAASVTDSLGTFFQQAKGVWDRLLAKIRRKPGDHRPLPNFYTILGVKPTATAEEIEAAYRAKTREHHPDRGGSDRAMADINAAHDVLSDPELRAEYDKHARRG